MKYNLTLKRWVTKLESQLRQRLPDQKQNFVNEEANTKMTNHICIVQSLAEYLAFRFYQQVYSGWIFSG